MSSRDSQEKISSHVLGSLQNVYIDLFLSSQFLSLVAQCQKKGLVFSFSVARAKVALD